MDINNADKIINNNERLEFHHIGVATQNINKEISHYQMLGYNKITEEFEDEKQGIKGIFLVAKNQPTIELLENLPERNTLDCFLKNRIKMYHFAYQVSDFEETIEFLKDNKAKLVSEPRVSKFFKKRICFFMLPNLFMIELIEK